MNIHEYQAKELLAKFGVPVPAGHAAMSVDEAVAAAEKQRRDEEAAASSVTPVG